MTKTKTKIDHTMKITTNDSDETVSRIIIEVNGFEIDILTDEEGISVDILKGNISQTSLEWGWNEKHINS